jgi:hypothetical protein
MNPIAHRLNQASVVMEGTPHAELVTMLRIGAEEIQRLQRQRDEAVHEVWRCRRFFFQTLDNPPNTGLAIIFNSILQKLGQTHAEGQQLYAQFYTQNKDKG